MGDTEAGEFEYGKYEDVGAIARQGRDRVKSAIAARQRAYLQTEESKSSLCCRRCCSLGTEICLQLVFSCCIIAAALYVAALALEWINLVGITSVPPGIDTASYQKEDLRVALENNVLVRLQSETGL